MDNKLHFSFYDFSKCIDFQKIEFEMGIKPSSELPVLKFEKEVIKKIETFTLDPDEKKIDDQLKTDGFDISFDEFAQTDNQLLVYKGRKVVAYIRDQRKGIDYQTLTSSYKYHLCECTALQDMKEKGWARRYVVARKNDNVFSINDLSQGKPQQTKLRMDLCGYCIGVLKSKRMWFYNFNLKAYFSRFDSYVPKGIRRVDSIAQIQAYTPDHDELSKQYRKAGGYECQECGVKCIKVPQLLHLHHKDGDKSHNYPHNLQVVCVDCHSRKPNHKHMINKNKKEIEALKKIQAEQGLFKI